ncbi:hypothetical protein SCLCIDRAFT_803045 [Scleroderma citrinum Foug A]|uniref:Uncharacterized protein n=1 Tax=Scleroderma citrinum Foug A TaxID=1036808 RepID=A0A0C3DPD1_9AGAM|nr:hypothetical protein SCLCIDRAFT_803045 [Scleroderma citrinum Foug A]
MQNSTPDEIVVDPARFRPQSIVIYNTSLKSLALQHPITSILTATAMNLQCCTHTQQRNVTLYLSTRIRSWAGSNSLKKMRTKIWINFTGSGVLITASILCKAMSIEWALRVSLRQPA